MHCSMYYFAFASQRGIGGLRFRRQPSDRVRQCFVEWIGELKLDRPRTWAPRNDNSSITPDVLLTERWGAVHVRPDGTVSFVSAPWTSLDHARWNLLSSVASEPLAISRALCHCIPLTETRPVLVYTDSGPVVSAAHSDCARAYSYWVLQGTLRDFAAAGRRVTIRHIPGLRNPADSLSRQEVVDNPALWLSFDDAWTYHRQQDAHTSTKQDEDGRYGSKPEWLQTARNPLRRLFSV
jgi:hypothetical protein